MKKSRVIFIVFLCLASFVCGQKKWSLQECVAYANENNWSVKQSKVTEKFNETEAKIAKNEVLPSVNASMNNGLNFGFQRTILGTYEYNQSYTNNWNIGADIVLWQKDKLKLNQKKANISIESQQLNTEKLKNDIALQVIANYLQIILNSELAKVSERQKNISADQSDKTEKLYKAGSIPYTNLVEQKANFSNDKLSYENALLTIERAKFQLAMLLQLEDYKSFDIQNIMLPENVNLSMENVDEIVNYAYQNQPAIAKAQKQKEAAEVEVALSKTALFPTITASYNLGTSYYDYFNAKEDGMFKQWYDNHNQVVSVGVNIPIFNKGNTKLRIEEAKLNVETYDNAIEQEKLALKQDIQTAYFDAEAAYKTFLMTQETMIASKTAFEYAQKSYNAGKINIYDFNITRNNYAIAESRMLQAKYDFIFKLKIIDFYAGRPLNL